MAIASKVTTQAAQVSDYGIVSYGRVQHFLKFKSDEQDKTISHVVRYCKKKGVELSSSGNENCYLTVSQKKRDLARVKDYDNILRFVRDYFDHDKAKKIKDVRHKPSLKEKPRLRVLTKAKFAQKLQDFISTGRFKKTGVSDERFITEDLRQKCICSCELSQYKQTANPKVYKKMSWKKQSKKIDNRLVVAFHKVIQDYLRKGGCFRSGCIVENAKYIISRFDRGNTPAISKVADSNRNDGAFTAALILSGFRLDFRRRSKVEAIKSGIVADPIIRESQSTSYIYTGLRRGCIIVKK